MRLRFDALYRGVMALLVVALLGSLWVNAQTESTNSHVLSSGPSTNNLATRLSQLDEVYVSFGLNRIEFLRDHALLGQPLWKYVASLVFVFLAFYVSKFLDFATRVWLKKLTARAQTRFGDLLLDLLNGPVKIVSFVIFLQIGLGLFQWPPPVADILSKVMIIVVAWSLTYMVIKLIDLVLGLWVRKAGRAQDEQFHKQLLPVIRRSLKVFAVIVSFLVTAPHLGLNITGLIASLSIGGLALGLAAQDTLANVFGAVSVFTDKPFHVADRTLIDNVDGVVESIGFRSTRVRNLDGHLVTIPNKTVANATITNITKRPFIRTIIDLGITYDSDDKKVGRAVALLEEIYRRHPNTQDVWISFNKFADFSLNIRVIHWWNTTDYKAYLAGMQELNLAIKQRFDAEGISFAFPTQTLHVKQEPMVSDRKTKEA